MKNRLNKAGEDSIRETKTRDSRGHRREGEKGDKVKDDRAASHDQAKKNMTSIENMEKAKRNEMRKVTR